MRKVEDQNYKRTPLDKNYKRTPLDKNYKRTPLDWTRNRKAWEERFKYELPQHISNGCKNDCG